MFSEKTLLYEEKLIACRRLLHKHAELSFEEYWTTEYLVSELEKIPGVTISRPAKTGVVASLRAAQPGRTIALRADIDALPIQEKTNLPFASENQGIMHACGHDGHTAIQLTALQILAQELAEGETTLRGGAAWTSRRRKPRIRNVRQFPVSSSS